MSVAGNKQRKGKNTKTSKDESEHVTSPTDVQETVQSTPTIKDWSKESKHIEDDDFVDEPVEESSETKKSVLDFDRVEVGLLDVGEVAKLSNEDLLKVLVRRGEEQKNPAVASGCKKVLRQINFEPSQHVRFQASQRGRRGTGHGRRFVPREPSHEHDSEHPVEHHETRPVHDAEPPRPERRPYNREDRRDRREFHEGGRSGFSEGGRSGFSEGGRSGFSEGGRVPFRNRAPRGRRDNYSHHTSAPSGSS
jgi:hypothetical protein